MFHCTKRRTIGKRKYQRYTENPHFKIVRSVLPYYLDKKREAKTIHHPSALRADSILTPKTNLKDINNETFILCPLYYVTHLSCPRGFYFTSLRLKNSPF